MLSNDPIDLTKDLQDLLPQAVIDEWLPPEHKSILFLFQKFKQYPPHPCHYILPSNLQQFLHQDPIQDFDFRSFLDIPPPALPEISRAYQTAINGSPTPILSVTLQPDHGNLVLLPAWIFDYWKEIGRVVDIRKQWKVALAWVKKQSTLPQARELCQNILLALSTFPWSHHAAYTKDITPLFLNSSMASFLNSFHINHVMEQIQSQYEVQHEGGHTTQTIFASVDYFNAILHFYGSVPAKKEGYLWDILMAVENKIVIGEVTTFCGVMNLPLHWVSVVINFQQLKILYGDSLGRKMPKREHHACKRWIKHLINRSSKFTSGEIAIGHLPIGNQKDSNSCGLFALNAIAHHYINTPLLPSDETSLVCC